MPETLEVVRQGSNNAEDAPSMYETEIVTRAGCLVDQSRRAWCI